MFFKKLFWAIPVIAFLFQDCSKKGSSTLTPSTSLKITVKDHLGNQSVSASVKLFSSQSDYINQTNAVASAITGTDGTATVPNLMAIQYYWYVKGGCEDNDGGAVTSASPLTANITNTTTVVLSQKGILKLVNNSSNPYKVYVNGVVTINSMDGSTTQLFNAPVGSYTIRVVQLSGYVLTPTDESFSGNLTCGNTLLTIFP